MSSETEAGKVRESGWRETIKIVVHALILAMIVRIFFYQPFNIPSGSMKQTLLVGDYLFVSKLAYGYSRYSFPWGIVPINGRIFGTEPKRGDVVVFKLPRDNSTDFIKRVIGLPGDEISVRSGVLYINGQAVPKVRKGDFIARRRIGQSRAMRKRFPTASNTSCSMLRLMANSTMSGPIRCRPAIIS
jgi:signal peptidase I